MSGDLLRPATSDSPASLTPGVWLTPSFCWTFWSIALSAALDSSGTGWAWSGERPPCSCWLIFCRACSRSLGDWIFIAWARRSSVVCWLTSCWPLCTTEPVVAALTASWNHDAMLWRVWPTAPWPVPVPVVVLGTSMSNFDASAPTTAASRVSPSLALTLSSSASSWTICFSGSAVAGCALVALSGEAPGSGLDAMAGSSAVAGTAEAAGFRPAAFGPGGVADAAGAGVVGASVAPWAVVAKSGHVWTFKASLNTDWMIGLSWGYCTAIWST